MRKVDKIGEASQKQNKNLSKQINFGKCFGHPENPQNPYESNLKKFFMALKMNFENPLKRKN